MAGPVQAAQGSAAATIREMACGPHAVYLMLRLHGVAASHELIERHHQVYPEGMTLAQVAASLRAEGLPAEVRRLRPDDVVDAARRPFLAYVEYSERGPGHLYVLTLSGDGDLQALDATTGSVVGTAPHKLEALWGGSGYAIVVSEGGTRWWLAILAVVVAAVALGCLSRLLLMRYRNARRLPAAGVSTGLGILLALASPLASASPAAGVAGPAPGPSTWRVPERSASNALFLLLKAQRPSLTFADYQQTHDARAVRSFHDMGRVASDLGLPVRLIRPDRATLMSLPLPACVLLEPDGVGSGSFAVIAEVRERDVTVIEGGPLRWVILSWEEFRRHWTGHVLLVDQLPSAGAWGGRDVTHWLTVVAVLAVSCGLTHTTLHLISRKTSGRVPTSSRETTNLPAHRMPSGKGST